MMLKRLVMVSAIAAALSGCDVNGVQTPTVNGGNGGSNTGEPTTPKTPTFPKPPVVVTPPVVTKPTDPTDPTNPQNPDPVGTVQNPPKGVIVHGIYSRSGYVPHAGNKVVVQPQLGQLSSLEFILDDGTAPIIHRAQMLPKDSAFTVQILLARLSGSMMREYVSSVDRIRFRQVTGVQTYDCPAKSGFIELNQAAGFHDYVESYPDWDRSPNPYWPLYTFQGSLYMPEASSFAYLLAAIFSEDVDCILAKGTLAGGQIGVGSIIEQPYSGADISPIWYAVEVPPGKRLFIKDK